jgi:putative flippase GtrA
MYSMNSNLGKFIVVGIVTTLIHILIVIALVDGGLGVSPVPANCIAFLSATAFSYTANTKWSFSREFSASNARRFLITASAGFAVAYCLASLAESYNWHYLAGVALIVVCLPILTFVTHLLWTYRE